MTLYAGRYFDATPTHTSRAGHTDEFWGAGQVKFDISAVPLLGMLQFPLREGDSAERARQRVSMRLGQQVRRHKLKIIWRCLFVKPIDAIVAIRVL